MGISGSGAVRGGRGGAGAVPRRRHAHVGKRARLLRGALERMTRERRETREDEEVEDEED